MKVLFPFSGSTVGGSHLSALALIKRLPELQIQPIILVHQKGLVSDLLEINHMDYSIYKKPYITAPGGVSALLQLRHVIKMKRFLEDEQIDIVHTNDGVIANNWLPAANLASRKSVAHVRRLWRPSRVSDFLHFRANKFIAISDFVHDSCPEIVRSRTVTIPNPVDLPTVTENRGVGKQIKELSKLGALIVSVGTINQQKRPELVIEAAALLKKQGKHMSFLLIGRQTPYIEKLKPLIDQYNILDRIHFIDYTQHVWQYIKAADILVAPAINEGWGRTLTESMHLRTPVLASNHGGHLEIIKDGFNGFLFDFRAPKALAESICKILEQKRMTKRLIETAQEYVQGHFSSQKHTERVSSVYYNLMSK